MTLTYMLGLSSDVFVESLHNPPKSFRVQVAAQRRSHDIYQLRAKYYILTYFIVTKYLDFTSPLYFLDLQVMDMAIDPVFMIIFDNHDIAVTPYCVFHVWRCLPSPIPSIFFYSYPVGQVNSFIQSLLTTVINTIIQSTSNWVLFTGVHR